MKRRCLYVTVGLIVALAGVSSAAQDNAALAGEFLHYLTFKEVHALQTGADPSSYRRAQRDFLKRHPLGWMGQVSERLEKIYERLPEDACWEVIVFYSRLVKLACRFLEREHSYLGTLLAD
jgi:TorA maturation chaperone TorD